MKTICLLCLFFSFFTAMQAQEEGMASYYSNYFNNRKTAGGQVYHKDSLVCAHRKHPFGTLLRVRNTKNKREVIVKVIDRGPYIRRRIIDLSLAAAKQLDFVRAGTAPVEVWVIAADSLIVDSLSYRIASPETSK